MRSARRSVLTVAVALSALVGAFALAAGAAPGVPIEGDTVLTLPNAPQLDGVRASSLLDTELVGRAGPPLSRSQLGPITNVQSLERMIAGSGARARATVRDLRQVVADTTSVDDRDPAMFGLGLLTQPGVAAGGVLLSSDRAALTGTAAKIDYDLWAVPLPVANGGTYRTDLTQGVRLTATPGINERSPAIGSGVIAYVAENSAPDEPEPPDVTVREDHIYVMDADGSGIRDLTANFGRSGSASVTDADADGWDIGSLTFDPSGAVIFSTNYGLDPSVYKLWIADDPGVGGTGTATPFGATVGLGTIDTDEWLYDNPDCNARGDVLLDTNLEIGGQARRVYLISGGELRPVTDGSQQVVQLGIQMLADTQPHWSGTGRDIQFVSNRVTGGADAVPEDNLWQLSDATAGVTAAEDEESILWRMGPVDEITTSEDVPVTTDAIQIGLTEYAAESIEAEPGDGDVFIIPHTQARISAPAGVTSQPVVNAGVKDLSDGSGLVVQADVRAFPAVGFGVADSEVVRAYAVIWRTPDSSTSYHPDHMTSGYQPSGGGVFPEYYVWPAPDTKDFTPDDSPWDDVPDRVNISLAYQLANNFYDNITGPYDPDTNARGQTNMATMAYLQAIVPLETEGPSPDSPGYTRWGNSTEPFDTSLLGAPGDKYIGIWLMGTAMRSASAGTPARVMNWEFLYDNLSGFTTAPWDPQGNTLIVDDYMDGQMFIQQIQYSRGSQEESYRAVGIPVSQHWGVEWSGEGWHDGGVTEFAPSDLVEGAKARFGSRNTSYPFDRLPADRWRIACRGPVTTEVLDYYLPELTPYKVYAPEFGETPEEQYRGPFTVTLPATGGVASYTPVDLYPGVRGVIWGSPYTGDLFTDKGTIADPDTHETIKGFVDQGGGLLLSGQDVAWALSLDGALQNPFLATYFGATYVSDDSGATGVEAPGGRGRYPFNPTANPVAFAPVNFSGFWSHAEPGVEVDATPMRFATITYTECASDGAVLHMQGAYDQMQQSWPDRIATTGGGNVGFNYNSGGAAATFMQHTPPGTGQWGGRTAFLGFGLEGVSREYNEWDTTDVECWLKRNKVVQSFLDWGRTARFDATVTAGSGLPGVPAGTPLPGVLVTARCTTGETDVVYGMLTDTDGYCLFRGLPIGQYDLKAYAPGLSSDHYAHITIWPEGTNSSGNEREGFSMLLAPAGTISGTVTDASVTDDLGDPLPLAGIRVVATATDADGDEIMDPLSRQSIVREATTGADGTYRITNVPSQTTYAVVANPDPKSTPVQLNHATDSTTYNETNLQTVTPATDTAGVDFSLEAMPGAVSGIVYVEGTTPRTPVAGATVRVVGATPAVTTTTDDTGAYVLPEVPSGTQNIEASAPGYAPSTVSAEVVANETFALDIPLSVVAPGAVSGTVRASDGITGISGVTIEAYFVGQLTPIATATTGADGTYSIDPLAAGSYTVKATDTAGKRALQPAAGRQVTVTTAQTTSGVNFTAVALASWGAGLRMISSPYSYPDVTSARLFGRAEDALSIAWWSPVHARYALYPESPVQHIVRGRGYFVRFDGTVTVDRTGEPAAAADFNAPFELPLSERNGGWNMIANPFDVEVDWYAAKFLYGGQTLSLAEAMAQRLVSGTLFTYVNGGYAQRTVLEPYVGYWAKAEKAGVILRLERPGAAAASARAASAAVRDPGLQWSLGIEAEVGDVSDRANFLGVSTEDQGVDPRFDTAEPPSVRGIADRDVCLYFVSGDAESGVRALASDIRPSLGSAAQWTFVVDTNVSNATARLTWPDLRSLPRSYSASLEDVAAGRTVSMRAAPSYDFATGANPAPREFRVTIRCVTASASSAPQVLGVESLSRGLTVTYRLAADADVEIRILNNSGRVVRTLSDGSGLSAGTHTASWDGRDDGGRLTPSGEYRIELTAVGADGGIGRATARAVR